MVELLPGKKRLPKIQFFRLKGETKMQDYIEFNIPFYITDYDVKQILDNAAFYVTEHKMQDGIEYKHKLEKYNINITNHIIDITINKNTTHLSMTEFKQKIIAFLKEQTNKGKNKYLFYDEFYKQETLDHDNIFPQDACKMVLYAIKKS